MLYGGRVGGWHAGIGRADQRGIPGFQCAFGGAAFGIDTGIAFLHKFSKKIHVFYTSGSYNKLGISQILMRNEEWEHGGWKNFNRRR